MTALLAPRYELPLIDPATGRMSREWYKFLSQLAKSVGTSTTATDDLLLFIETDPMTVSQSITNITTQDTSMLYINEDQPKQQDLSILAWWPGDSK